MSRRFLLLLLALPLLIPAPGSARQTPEGGSRTASVLDLQGSAWFRPVGRERWSPLAPGDPLHPGDMVRTNLRGAHAVEFRLGDGGKIVLGPGGLAELRDDGEVKLVRGEASVVRGGVERFHRAYPGGTRILDGPPRWLTGYRSSTTEEWMGSIIAKVDGRNVPLTISACRIDVVVRDQIAETTVDTSFRNNTSHELEGEFSFPLPAGASVSGFGMWVGGELIMADIVERQRARRIYEDIRRRKKDPGLLEWSGGNVFTARVYPIAGMSMKKVRIRFTQVLPLRGKSYVYRYPLRSEMTLAHPLKRLGLEMTVHSASGLESVKCTSHDARATRGADWAGFQYSSEGEAPASDFEAVITLSEVRPVTVVTHQRGEDGYFMVLLTPPAPEAAGWERELTPEGEPIDLVLLADTSASMGRDDRETQAKFLETLLSQLGPGDTFRLAACDVEVAWWKKESAAATPENMEEALSFLDARHSLGWTDLDKALDVALRATDAGSHLIYVGDGIGTTGDADAGALARRIKKLGRPNEWPGCHAVATGSSFEDSVLDAIASRGGGSVHHAPGDPAGAARTLLKEITCPGFKNLRVTFDDIRVAKVYPEDPPSLPAGSQLAILGRFLPTDGPQEGRIHVVGHIEEQTDPTYYTIPLTVKPGDAGNSFLPRLWARAHIDALLLEEQTPEIREEIVARSRLFNIMTPYTSLLVLEDPEDRQRYGVERRVRMRDGEEFFAEAKDHVATETLRQQVRKGRLWRESLRETVIREIASLGRNLPHGGYGYASPSGGFGFGFGGSGGAHTFGGTQFGMSTITNGMEYARRTDFEEWGVAYEGGGPDDQPLFGVAEESEEPLLSELEDYESVDLYSSEATVAFGSFRYKRFALNYIGKGLALNKRLVEYEEGEYGFGYGGVRDSQFLDLFPRLMAPQKEHKLNPNPEWHSDVTALLTALARLDFVDGIEGGIATTVEARTFHALRGAVIHLSRNRGLLTRDAWYEWYGPRGNEPAERWCVNGERGALNPALQLGRKRAAVKTDHARGLFVPGLTSWNLIDSYRTWNAEREDRPDGTAVIRFTPKEDVDEEIRVVADTTRLVVLSQETWREGVKVASVRYADFVKAGARWWPRTTQWFDKEGRQTSRSDTRFETVSAKEARWRLGTTLLKHFNALFMPGRDPDIGAAKQAVFEDGATFAEHLTVALHHGAAGRWERMWKAFELAEKAAAGKQGLEWIRAKLLAVSRRGEELAPHVMRLAGDLQVHPGPWFPWQAWSLLNLVEGESLGPEEMLSLADALEGGVRLGVHGKWWKARWALRRARWLVRAKRTKEAEKLVLAVAAEYAEDSQIVWDCLNRLKGHESPGAALAVARRGLAHEARWFPHEVDRVYDLLTELLWDADAHRTFLAVALRWATRRPDQVQAWDRFLHGMAEVDPAAAEHWIQARLEGELPVGDDEVARARLTSALQYALGGRWRGWLRTLDVMWEVPLTRLADRLLEGGDHHLDLAGSIVDNWRFKELDPGRRFQDRFRKLLETEALREMPSPRLARIAGWINWDPSVTDRELGSRVVSELERRLPAEENENLRMRLGYVARNVLEAREDEAGIVAHLRRRLEGADDDVTWQLSEDLYQRLLGRPWTDAVEEEIFSLLPRTFHPESTPENRRTEYPGRVLRAVQALRRARIEAALGTRKERRELPRQELRMRVRKAKVEAREGLIRRLTAVAEHADAELRTWLRLERLCLLAESGGEVMAEARALIGVADDAEENDILAPLLRERAVLALTLAVTRPDAPKGLADQTLEFLTARIEGAEDPFVGQYRVFRLLVASSRDLLDTVRGFIRESQVDSRWRVVLGHLLAERGETRKAVARLEAAAALGELDSSGYALLADLYLALSEDERRAAALRMRDATADLDALHWVVEQAEDRLWGADEDEGPVTIEAEALEALRNLLSRTPDPGYPLRRLRNFYRQTKDHRVLSGLADALLGHSPERVYFVLSEVKESLLDEVHEEATTDAVVKAIAERGGDAKGPLDRRALRLLTILVERRAAEVLDQPGAHSVPARQALEEAFKEEWQPDEPRLYAEFLASLGAVADDNFRREHLRQLRAIHLLDGHSPLDALAIAHALTRTLWAYDVRDQAVVELVKAIAICRRRHEGTLPRKAREATDSLIGWLEAQKVFHDGEEWLDRVIAGGPEDPDWYRARKLHLYASALAGKRRVSFGDGADLYRGARAAMLESLGNINRRHLPSAYEAFLRLHKAFGKGAKADLVAFSRGGFKEVIRRFPPDQRYVKTINLATALAEVASPHAALTFHVERLETEPGRLRRAREGGWYHSSRHMHQLFRKVKDLGDLEPRLLAVVLTELRQDLLSLSGSHRTFYGGNSSRLWMEKKEVFLTEALRFAEEHAHSPTRILHAAVYIATDLKQPGKAIEVLVAAHERGDLREDGRYRLARLLMKLGHWEKAADHLMALVEKSPGNADYYPDAVKALGGAGRDEEGRAIADVAGQRLRDREVWIADYVYDLATAVLHCGYFSRSAALYEEMLTLLRDRRSEAEEMPSAYVGLARSLSGLGKHAEAVEAASAAVVAWGDTYYEREEALETLREVIAGIEDLGAWVAGWEREAGETGLDSGVIRHAIGDIYFDKRQPAVALPHLKKARALSPEDAAVHRSIVLCCRKLKDFDGELDAVVAWLHAATEDDAPLGKLATALRKKGRLGDAERVWTTFAELTPHEADGHRRLAKVRERQKRYAEAVVQWEQVVRTRDFDPAGWMGLAAALKKAGDENHSRAVLEEILKRSWNPEFGDPRPKARKLLNR